MDLAQKVKKLENLLWEMEGVVVAFSGGVDSTLLLFVAHNVLGEKALGVIASSESYPVYELEEAQRIAGLIGVRYRVIETSELDVPGFMSNPPDRCYYCKKELFVRLKAIAEEEKIPFVAEGSNVDDIGDYRPGLIAVEELGVRSPLREAGLTKLEIRELSRKYGLSTWNKPAYACLASRFPYGNRITREKLLQVSGAEDFLRSIGIRQSRVRSHGKLARLEVSPEDISRIICHREDIVKVLKDLGFVYVALDIEGYRAGSMNETLKNRFL